MIRSMQEETLKNSVEMKMHSEPSLMHDDLTLIERNGSCIKEFVAGAAFEQKEATANKNLLDAVDNKFHRDTVRKVFS